MCVCVSVYALRRCASPVAVVDRAVSRLGFPLSVSLFPCFYLSSVTVGPEMIEHIARLIRENRIVVLGSTELYVAFTWPR
jgi:hypothetical protein